MGCCCSFFGNSEDEATTKETEMAAQKAASKSLAISSKMSAPTITVEGGDNHTICGKGLAIVAVALEQDAAYWEWRISLPARKHIDTILFGVASKKDRKYYEELKAKELVEEGEWRSCGRLSNGWRLLIWRNFQF